MENFTFYNPTKVFFGKNTISRIGKEIHKAGIQRILLVSGGGSTKTNGVYEQVIKSLMEFGIDWVEYWGVKPNPVLSHTLKGIELARENELEAVLAVGGGSVIDEAKSIAAGFYLDNLWDAFEKKVQVELALPVYTVLTLSGTGSEMDLYAVITNEDEKKKWNIGADCLYPRISIIDPSVQMSLPWNQTVNGAIDAMSHIMENYFMGSDEEATLGINESLMRTIIKSIDSLHLNGKDYNARANLAWSATLALNGISGVAMRGGDWACHRIEHAISAMHPGVAHGAGLGVIFPAWLKFVTEYNPSLFDRWSNNVWDSATTEEAIVNMKNKFHSWNAPVSLSELGINESEINNIASNSMRFGVVGSLKVLTHNDIVDILKIAF